MRSLFASVRRSRLRVHAGLLLAVAAFAGGAAGAAEATGLFAPVERSTIDARFAMRGRRRPPSDVAIVALDAHTLQALGRRPPLPRALHARVIDTLHHDRARLIAYDFQFIGASDPRDDRKLARALEAARPVVLATHDTSSGPIPVPGGVRRPIAPGIVPASAAVLTDPDDEVRRMLYAPVDLPTFPVVTARLALGHPVSQAAFPDNAAWIDYYGPPGTFRTYSMADVLAGRVPARALTGKLVLVGATDPIDKDVFQTSISSIPMSGIEVQANALATILAGFPLRPADAALTGLLIALLALAPALTAARLAAWAVVATAALMGAAFLAVAQLEFDDGVIVPVTYPLAGLGLATIGAVAAQVTLESRARRTLRALFARFVPTSLVDELVEQVGEDHRLPGRRVEATVLFCDLRGFTTFSEGLDPERVLDVAHEYLRQMSNAILDHGGTLVTFMGDGLMALFGAPLAQADHADRALAAAREILEERLPLFNRWLSDDGLGGPFRIGIGLNTGPVMAGSVGSDRRMEYTVIGDTVNTAARIQEMTKTLGAEILLSQSTLDALLDGPARVTLAGMHPVRGRSAPIRLFTLAQ